MEIDAKGDPRQLLLINKPNTFLLSSHKNLQNDTVTFTEYTWKIRPMNLISENNFFSFPQVKENIIYELLRFRME